VTPSDQNEPGPASAQALSDSLKEAVKSWVPKVRKALDDEFGAQLERLGLRRNGKHVALDKMSLPSASVAVRHRAEALVARESLSEGTPERGYDNVVRELTYTLLNRLVGLKAMEARKLLYLPPPGDANASPEETEVITPVPGQARSRYLRDFRAAGGSRYKYEDDAEEALLREGLTSAFRHVTSEIRVLFDPDHEYASVWPTHAALTGVLKMINEDLPADAYRAQDFLGWVYQFFNRDEKKRVRDENKGTPRSSYELAVINQFYTPSWVVKALVDNTLGRLWLQMHPDSALAAKVAAAAAGEAHERRGGCGLPRAAHGRAHPLHAADRRWPGRGVQARHRHHAHRSRVRHDALRPVRLRSLPPHVPRRDRARWASRAGPPSPR
jgi:hypothetical protein